MRLRKLTGQALIALTIAMPFSLIIWESGLFGLLCLVLGMLVALPMMALPLGVGLYLLYGKSDGN